MRMLMNSRHITLALAVVAGSAVALAAPPAPAQSGAQPATERTMIDDATITDVVNDELLIDPSVMSYKIDVRTRSGVVTLSGEVNNLLARKRAERIASTIRGVKEVKNEITVAPPEGRSDAEIRNDVLAALVSDPATDELTLDVQVADGKVTLAGVVESMPDKRIAGMVAASVRGVTAVENDIKINYVATRSDQEIRTDVMSALRWDTLVDHALLEVNVADGKVKLTGVVGSAAELQEARMDAWVNGVRSVDASSVRVERWARDAELRKDKYTGYTDAEIRDAVEDQMLYSPRVNSFNVRTSVDDGVVTLRGGVDNLMAKRQATREARSVVGVRKVKNRLTVAPAADRTDEEIRSDVAASLLRSVDVDRYEVDVDVRSDEVTLTGLVDSWWEKARAGDLAASVNGVVAVNNNLVVDDAYEPLVYDPYVYDYDPVIFEWYDYDPPMTVASDADIREDINDQLFWSPFVDANQVDVSVANGVATLTGEVDSWSERWAATENAYEGGAVWVNNDLEVAGS